MDFSILVVELSSPGGPGSAVQVLRRRTALPRAHQDPTAGFTEICQGLRHWLLGEVLSRGREEPQHRHGSQESDDEASDLHVTKTVWLPRRPPTPGSAYGSGAARLRFGFGSARRPPYARLGLRVGLRLGRGSASARHGGRLRPARLTARARLSFGSASARHGGRLRLARLAARRGGRLRPARLRLGMAPLPAPPPNLK